MTTLLKNTSAVTPNASTRDPHLLHFFFSDKLQGWQTYELQYRSHWYPFGDSSQWFLLSDLSKKAPVTCYEVVSKHEYWFPSAVRCYTLVRNPFGQRVLTKWLRSQADSLLPPQCCLMAAHRWNDSQFKPLQVVPGHGDTQLRLTGFHPVWTRGI